MGEGQYGGDALPDADSTRKQWRFSYTLSRLLDFLQPGVTQEQPPQFPAGEAHRNLIIVAPFFALHHFALAKGNVLDGIAPLPARIWDPWLPPRPRLGPRS